MGITRDERATWWALAMYGAADAERGICSMRDADARKALTNSVAYTRRRANELWELYELGVGANRLSLSMRVKLAWATLWM